MPETNTSKPQGETGKARAQTLEQKGSQERRGLSRWQAPSPLAASPFDFIERMADQMDRTFDRIFRDFGFGRTVLPRSLYGMPTPREGIWSPRVEAFQRDDRFTVRAELPGLKKDDIQVDVTDEAITLQGERRSEEEEHREGYHHTELSYGQFYRSIPVPEGVIAESAKASFKDGVLEVTMQAAPPEANRGRRLEITEASGGGEKK